MSLFLRFFLRLLGVVLFWAMAIGVLLSGYYYTSILFGFFGALLTVDIYLFTRKIFSLYDRTHSAILQSDYSSDFSGHPDYKHYEKLFEVYHKLKGEEKNALSKEFVYRSILDQIESGILILKKEETDWRVIQMNEYFSYYFGVPKISSWNYLNRFLPSLCQVIQKEGFSEFKTAIQIRPPKQERQMFVLQTARNEIYEQTYYIILLDSVQNLIDKKEKEAYVNLMKVIAHELMNSLTPIQSLSQHISDSLNQDSLSQEDKQDLKESAQTIIKRNKHLQKFVDSYRQLSMLPSPQKQWTTIDILLQNCLHLMQSQFEEKNVKVVIHNVLSVNLYVDLEQLEQVLINLISNSLYAMESVEQKELIISTRSENQRLHICITDNGKGIEKNIEEKIFLPFFTTRSAGAGIGLTLSKAIVEAHRGHLIFYREDNGNTTFDVILPITT